MLQPRGRIRPGSQDKVHSEGKLIKQKYETRPLSPLLATPTLYTCSVTVAGLLSLSPSGFEAHSQLRGATLYTVFLRSVSVPTSMNSAQIAFRPDFTS